MPSVTEQAFAVEGGDAPSRNAEHALPGRKLVKTASQVVRDEKIVYVSNLPYQAEVPAIEDIFHKEGVHVEHVEVLKKGHGTYKTGCGLAVVTLRLAEDKEAALQKMEGKLVYGRAMMVRGDRFA